jgi:ABC-2 type transport system permease protein
MRLLEPPGWPWLLRHELRLAWRRKDPTATKALIFLGAVGWVLLHVVAWFLTAPVAVAAILHLPAQLALGLAAFVVLVILSIAFGAAVVAIFDRGDLDLLGTAPIPPSTFYTVRGLGVALSSVVLVAYVWMPFVHMGALHGHWRMLLAYPALGGLGLGSAALALVATLALARAFGAHRARVLAQLVGAFAGAAMVLGAQARTLLPEGLRRAIAGWAGSEQGRAWLGEAGPLGWLAHAFAGQGLAPWIAIAGGTASFVLVVIATQRAFVDAAQRGREVAARGTARGLAPRFKGGLGWAVLRKELRAIVRDPVLIGNSLLQVLFLIPLLVIALRHAAPLTIVAPAVIVIASSLAGSLAWIAVAGEEAPDLLRSAPVSLERLRWLKALAAAAPVAALLLPFIAWYAATSGVLALVVAVFALLALASAATIQVWTARPAARRDLRLKPKARLLVNLLEMLTAFGWAGACYLALRGSLLAIPVLAAACLGPALAWAIRRTRGD